MTPWSVACQAALSMGFSRQEYWSGLPCLSPGDLPDPRIEPISCLADTLLWAQMTATTWNGLFSLCHPSISLVFLQSSIQGHLFIPFSDHLLQLDERPLSLSLRESLIQHHLENVHTQYTDVYSFSVTSLRR